MTQNELFKFIDQQLQPLGFQKKDNSWYKENLETITILALEKSRWGEIYYMSLCVFFRQLDQQKRPKFYKAHGRIRTGSLGENTEEYLNLEKNMDDSIRKQRIKKLLDKSLPVLSKMENSAGIIELLEQFNPRLFMLSNQAQEYLGVKVE